MDSLHLAARLINYFSCFYKPPLPTIHTWHTENINEDIPQIVVIESKEIADSFRQYFEWLWKLSEISSP